MTSLIFFPTSFLILCASVGLKYHTDQKKKKRTTATMRNSLWTIEMNLYQPCPLTCGGMFLPSGGFILWVRCRDCKKAQEMNVLSARAKKTRLQRGRRNKYLNLTHLLLPSQTKQAADTFLSSNKTRFSLAWWRLPLLNHIVFEI